MTTPSAHLAPIERTDLFREVLTRIEGLIGDGALGPGDRLPSDRQLAKDLGVSRPLVRQALKVLEGIGRITAQQGVGTFVREDHHALAMREITHGISLDLQFVRDLYPVRKAIELEVLRAALNHNTPDLIDLLQRTLDDQAEHVAQTTLEVPLDVAFEAALGQMCGNTILVRFQALIHEMWLKANLSLIAEPGDKDKVHNEHLAIFEAIREGNSTVALELMESHQDSLGR